MKIVLFVFCLLIFGYAGLAGFVYLKQGRLVYFPSSAIENTPKDIGLIFEDVTFTASDGTTISGWYIPASDRRGVVLFCHGNGGNVSHRLDSIRIFHDLKLAVFIFDYRGYGMSTGSPTEEGTYRDGEGAWDYLVRTKDVPPEEVILFGESLGSAVAAETALRRKVGALILASGFTSVPELGRIFYPFLPVTLMSRYHYATIKKVGVIRVPKLIIHSPHDEIVPFGHGVALFKEAAEPKEFLEITGSHNEGFVTSGSVYVEGLDRFIAKYF